MSTLLGTIWALGTVVTPGCKSKVAEQPTAGDQTVSVAPNTRYAPLAEAIHRHLAQTLARRPPRKGEQIVDVDKIGSALTLKRWLFGKTVRGRLRTFVRNTTSLRSRTDPLLCWVRQRGATWTVLWCRVGKTSFGLGISPQRTKGLDDASLGVAACDALDAYFRCYTQKLQPPGGPAMLRAWRTQKRAYREILKTPAGRAKISQACQKSMDQIRRNSRTKDCVQ